MYNTVDETRRQNKNIIYTVILTVILCVSLGHYIADITNGVGMKLSEIKVCIAPNVLLCLASRKSIRKGVVRPTFFFSNI